MMTPFEAAEADVKIRREALLRSAGALRVRLSLPQLTEDALHLLDPGLSWLGRLRESLQRHRLLGLAMLAAAGWLADAARHHTGGPRDAAGRNRASTTRKPEGEHS